MRYEVVEKQFLFEDPPFRVCHASTIVALKDGDLLAAWFSGTQEKHPDTAIWCARRTNGVWGAMSVISIHEELPHYNPVLAYSPNGDLVLFYKVGFYFGSWYTLMRRSQDDGRTWSEPIEVVPGDVGGRGPVKNKPIIAHNGSWLAPASVEGANWDSFVDISLDDGRTWTRGDTVPIDYGRSARGIIQPSLWESAPGIVHMIARSRSGGLWRSDSSDSGLTWNQAYATGLPSNNTGIDLALADNGILSLVLNPSGEAQGIRTPLVLLFSKDNGRTWMDEFVLEDAYGDYSYPAVIADGDHLYITYTWRFERIAFWHLRQT